MSEDKTQPPPPPRPEEDDGDRTLLVPMPGRPGAPVPEEDEDDDRTRIGGGSTYSPATPPQGTTYSPMSPPPPAAGAPSDPSGQSTPPAAAPQVPPVPPVVPPVAPAAPPVAPAAQPVSEPLRVLEPGTIINNMYQVEQSLDQGGMGRVFRGVEIATGEPVAIKVILPEMADEKKVADMFRREARTLRQLHHDAIVRYFAYVPPDDRLNLHALVMGFIEGTKLSDRIRDVGPLSRSEICRLFIRLADGLHRAHEIGVVHRDLSPDNVMLQDGEIDKAVLIDFGISRSSRIKDVTLGNEFAGKLKYVSPEQLGAYGGEADARSDVYSLGLLMIIAATGVPAPMGYSIVEAVKKREEVPDLSGVPAEFQSLLYQMLQPDPKNRLPDMGQVKQALQAIAGGSQFGTTEMTATSRTAQTQTNVQVPGLQHSPAAGITGMTQTGAVTQRGATQGPAVIPEPEPEKRRGGMGLLLGVVVIGALGIGGALFWSQGAALLGGAAAPGESASDGGPERAEGTPGAFFADALADTDCAYATLREGGALAGGIEAFAGTGVATGPLDLDYAGRFGDQPQMTLREVSPAQCSVPRLARSFQGTTAPAVELALDPDRQSKTEGIVGTVTGAGDRTLWLALVAPSGRIFALTQQVQPPVDGVREFAFRMPAAQPGTYLLVTIASDRPLTRTGALKDGTAAADAMDLIGRELAGDSAGAVDIGFLDVPR